jgi:hypothetical protein
MNPAAGLAIQQKQPQSNTMKLDLTKQQYAAHISIDWADRKHDIGLYDCQTKTWEHKAIQASPEAIADWVNGLRRQYGDRPLLRSLLIQLNQFEEEIEKLFESLPDAALFQTLPGAGPHLAPRLLAAFGEDRSRFDSAQALMSYIGITPVKEESGKKSWVHWRWSCPIFLRQTFVEWVDQARRHSVWSQAFYKQQRSSGKSHAKAIRALAYKWGRILWRCWQDGVAYDEEKYVAALRRKKSPLIKLLGA